MSPSPTLPDVPVAPGAPDALSRGRMRDAFGRTISYLRISVTDRCDLRCRYCMAEDMTFMPRRNLLSTDELVGIAHHFIDRGIDTIRLTGGEPLTRKDIDDVARRIGERLGYGLRALNLTTNATLLDQHARALADAGVRRVNISLDTLDPIDFAYITRGGSMDAVLRGIAAARDAGLSIRINMVAMAGFNDHMLPDMLDFCEDGGFDLGLIESMPMGDTGSYRPRSHVAMDEFLAPITRDAIVEPIDHKTPGPARWMRIKGRNIRIGLIAPISHNFCDGCNRIRMGADGKVHGCLGHDAAIDLAAAWRDGGVEGLSPLLDRLMATKAERHIFRIGETGEHGPSRHMSATGG